MIDLFRIIKGLRITNDVDSSKQAEIQVSTSATTATTSILVFEQTSDVTVTVPDATTTLVGQDTVDTLTNKSIDADDNIISNIEDADIKVGAAINAAKIADGSVDNTEFQFLDGVTSNIQDQLDTGSQGLADHIADPTDAHAASAISNVPSGNLSATDVQGALNELQTDVDTRVTTATNVGTGDGNVFKQKTGSTLELKTIKAGTGVTIIDNASDVTIDVSGGGGANTFLSNLTSPTAINKDLLPDSNTTRNIGSSVVRWLSTHATALISYSLSGADILSTRADLTGLYTGAPSPGAGVSFLGTSGAVPLYYETQKNATADATATNEIIVRSGDKTAGTGNSGDLTLRTGTSSGGARGKIKFVNGTEGTAAAQWRSTDTVGTGAWVSPNYAISSDSGSVSTSSASATDVTNLSVTITTTGRPVVLQLIAADGTNVNAVQIFDTAANTVQGFIYFVEGSTVISQNEVYSQDTGATAFGVYPACSFRHFYVPAAGTYTYKVQQSVNAGTNQTIRVAHAKLVAYEI